jgi:hypothetical protein
MWLLSCRYHRWLHATTRDAANYGPSFADAKTLDFNFKWSVDCGLRNGEAKGVTKVNAAAHIKPMLRINELYTTNKAPEPLYPDVVAPPAIDVVMGIVACQSAKNALSPEFKLVLEELLRKFPIDSAPEGPAASVGEDFLLEPDDEQMADEDALLRASREHQQADAALKALVKKAAAALPPVSKSLKRSAKQGNLEGAKMVS